MLIDRKVKKHKLINDLSSAKYFTSIAKPYWRNGNRYWTYRKYVDTIAYRLENVLKVLKILY